MASDQVKRKLAAILAADIAGYSRLMGADEACRRDRSAPAARAEAVLHPKAATVGRAGDVRAKEG